VSRALVFRELLVRRMPGFPGGGPRLDELSPGINLVHGPNASGKTTAALALQALLWPRTAPVGAGLAGRFDVGGDAWRVDVDGVRASWQREGQDVSAPPLPPAEDRDRYLLSLHGLLRDDDRDLADRIRVESAGGYDLRAAASSLGFGAGGRPIGLIARRAQAQAALDEAREREASLCGEAAELERLRRRRRELERTARTHEPIRLALELARARKAETAARQALAAFPEGVALLRGVEVERLEEWERARAATARSIADAESAAARADAELAAAGLGEAGVPTAVLVELEARLDALRRLDDDRARARDDLAAARARRDRAGAGLGILAHRPDDEARTGTDHTTSPDPTLLDRLDRLVRRAGELRERRAALDERVRALGGQPAPGGDGAANPPGLSRAASETAGDAVRVLRRWLRAGARDDGAATRLRRLLIVTAATLGLAGAAAAVLGAPVVKAVGVALMLVAVMLIALRPGRESDDRGALEREARRLGHTPERWTPEAVESTLDALERRVAAERVAGERHAEAERLAVQQSRLEAEEAALRAERDALATETGLAPHLEDLTFHLLATRLHAWEEASDAVSAASGVLAAIEADRRDALEGAAETVARYGYAARDEAGLAGALKELRDRRERHQAAAGALSAARAERDRALAERADVEARRSELFERLGLDLDREHVLRAWADRLPSYRTARSELQLAERARAAAEAAAGAPPDTDLFDPPIPSLVAALADAESAAAEERELAERIVGIEARLEQARQKHDVEDALAQLAEVEAELADRRDADVEAEVGAVLVEWLSERAADHNRPAVFHRARDLFGLISRGRYRLDMDDADEAAFRAFDTTTHRGHALDELSSGTRLQLLLAVRLAFVETQETGAALPLLLDEVLANCDDDRASAIIDAALAIARAGRQIFYFTAQADELAKWQARLQAHDDIAWCVRGILDASAADLPAIDWPHADRDEVPAPEGMDHAAYGRALRVPPFDPWVDGVGGLHLWYVIDDVDALHQLLRMGVRQWGQLDYLAAVGGESALPGGMRDVVVEDARRVAALCDRFRQLWRQGRGRPVDRAALAESGAISDTFLDRVAELCDELDGDGEALVEALAAGRVPRFRTAQADELRAFLLERGYVVDEEPLAPEQIRIMLAAEAGDVSAADALVERLGRGAARTDLVSPAPAPRPPGREGGG
jgi:hypothetical protein